ncbi:MAG: hypothetical protein EOO43_19595, partial [Flavobacterium sp.]
MVSVYQLGFNGCDDANPFLLRKTCGSQTQIDTSIDLWLFGELPPPFKPFLLLSSTIYKRGLAMTDIINQETNNIQEIDLMFCNPLDYQHRVKIDKPETAYQLMRYIWEFDNFDLVQRFKLILLDNADTCLGFIDLTNHIRADFTNNFRIIYAVALKANASSVILVQNHIDGDTSPTENDVIITKEIAR